MLSKNEAIEMAKRLIVDSIWKSARLEGYGTTFPVTEAILANAEIKGCTTNEVLFVVNMKRAWQFLIDNIDYPNNLMLLREFNKIVGYSLFYNAGAIRTIDVQIGGTKWKPTIPDQALINERLSQLQGITDIEIQALKAFCFVARTQMFIDGNKRVAQLICNKILMENNIGIFQVDPDLLIDFTKLLVEFYESDDDTSIIKFMKDNCIKRVPPGQSSFPEATTF